MRRVSETVKVIREDFGQTKRGARLEKVFGPDGFVSLSTYAAGLNRARTVARIGMETGGRGAGTGFLVRGIDLSDRYGDQWVLLTNAHVISARTENEPAVTPNDAVITFEALPLSSSTKASTYGVGSILWESSPNELDATIIALDRPVDGLVPDDQCEFAKALPVNNQKGRVYIIGHPGGGVSSCQTKSLQTASIHCVDNNRCAVCHFGVKRAHG